MANGIIGNTLTTPIAIPKKVSQLENDMQYVTNSVASKWDSDMYDMCMLEINYRLSEVDKKADKPTITNEDSLGGVEIEFSIHNNAELRTKELAFISFVFFM